MVYSFCGKTSLVLQLKTKIAPKLLAQLEKKMEFQRFVMKMRSHYNYPLGSIGNMDETLVQLDMLSKYTVNVRGVKTVTEKSTGHGKSQFTVVLACLANTVKLKSIIIFQRKTNAKVKTPSRSLSIRAEKTVGLMEMI